MVTVGDELVLGERGNENSRWMSEWLKLNLRPAGVQLSLPDDVETIAQWLKQLLQENHFPVLVAGGLEEPMTIAPGQESPRHLEFR